MKTFKEYLQEALLIESKLTDLKTANPDIASDIDKYHEQDPTPTKKYLPWLVKQHKAGNLTPNDTIKPVLTAHMNNQSKLKSDHTQYKDYNEMKSDVDDNTTDTKSEQKVKAVAGLEKLHDADGIQAFHVKTKAAAIHRYGFGKEQGTPWCIAAKGKADEDENLFGDEHYGPTYTVEKKGDQNSPYAYHPENGKGTITNKHNDGDKPVESVVAKNEWMKPIIQKLKTHHDILERSIDNAQNTKNQDEISKALDHPNNKVGEAAAENTNASESNLLKALNHKNIKIARNAAWNPSASEHVMSKALDHSDSAVGVAAVNNRSSTENILQKALNTGNEKHAFAVLAKPRISDDIFKRALGHKIPKVAELAKFVKQSQLQ